MVANIAVLFSQLTLAVALHHRLDQNLESEGLEECWDRHRSSPKANGMPTFVVEAV